MKNGCSFCDYGGPNAVVDDFGDVFVIEPLNPVTPGHCLLIPKEHTNDPRSPAALRALEVAAWGAAAKPCNIIVSLGREATQTVEHFHVHLVPRRDGDGLALPWTAQKGSSAP